MGPVKAALEACCRYLAYELGRARASACTRSRRGRSRRARRPGLKDFDLLLTEAAQRAPIGELVDIMDVGFTCALPRDAVRAADCRARRSTSTAASTSWHDDRRIPSKNGALPTLNPIVPMHRFDTAP